ncbi:DUF1102 domain-containing protein [Natranaeroarchaeum sulfidigenes]|uniref:DUF1102 family n=1 Tax=Natranaeroarchaeum sulfidigenes TaxID=2784880 RepID=A0A897N0J5_9EURY|nr:DUF1102 domain-containing protein [Natranaeroarchaeum sulfidigenes]QSG03876.1 DUF1102 family [Natranaeroarchaeum sulfidigenes]
MNRRRFLGVTAGTAAGSALLGSGAFNIARVDRGLDVEVVKDQLAYLSLSETPDDQGRSYEVGGQVFLEIPGIHEEADAEGVGMDSEYWFDDILQITNRGTETIEVDTKIEMDDGIEVTLYDSDDPDRTLFTDEPFVLSVGESITAGLYINTFGVSTGSYSGELTIAGEATED